MRPGRSSAVLLAAALLLAGCGGSGVGGGGSAPAPSAAEFPKPAGRGLEQMLVDEGGNPSDQGPFIVEAGAVHRPGKSRFIFALLDAGRDVVTDVKDIALYVADGPTGKVSGPFPAARESLRTERRFRSKTTANDKGVPPFIFRADVRFPHKGNTYVAGLIRRDGRLQSVQPAPIAVKAFRKIPAEGERAIRIHTPTVKDVPSVKEIDTRDPPTTQHQVDLYDVLGRKPVVLLFATPLLCQSRICGPVADITEQLKQTRYRDSDVQFIHMEIYRDNDPNKGYRKQVLAYGLPSEPWVFVIDRRGIVRAALEGGFGIDELDRAIRKVARPS